MNLWAVAALTIAGFYVGFGGGLLVAALLGANHKADADAKQIELGGLLADNIHLAERIHDLERQLIHLRGGQK